MFGLDFEAHNKIKLLECKITILCIGLEMKPEELDKRAKKIMKEAEEESQKKYDEEVRASIDRDNKSKGIRSEFSSMKLPKEQ